MKRHNAKDLVSVTTIHTLQVRFLFTDEGTQTAHFSCKNVAQFYVTQKATLERKSRLYKIS
jgi:hypothetical protein